MEHSEETKITVNESLQFCEFESKYRVDGHKLVQFKQLVESLVPEKFIYVEGPDYFFTYPTEWFEQNKQWDSKGTFTRYRKPSYGLDQGRRQVSWKYLPLGSNNNIQRTEYNWDIGDTPEDVIFAQLKTSGLTHNCTLVKHCHIYKFQDATLVYYTVYDTTDGEPKSADNFVEIEVDEEKIATMTESEAFGIIVKYEGLLKDLGISAQKRTKRSLFQMYKR